MSIKRTISIGRKNSAGKPAVVKAPKWERTPNPSGKHLVIVESPAKAKTIEKILGKNYKVMASMGHLRDLPKNSLGVDVENGFMPRYTNVSDRHDVISHLRAEANRSRDVILATDPDREGEAISHHLSVLLDVPADENVRITFNEITPHAIKEAIAQPRPIDEQKVDAQQARRVLDRLVGYKLSPFLWKKVFRGLSAGRVQSVAVRLICEREEEIKAFVPEEYWSIEADYHAGKGKSFTAKVVRYDDKELAVAQESVANDLVEELKAADAYVEKLTRGQQRRRPQAPFTTSTMQQDSVNRLNFGARKTMMIAQQLYEGLDIRGTHVGLITYMRTDSVRIAEEMQKEAKQYITETYGKEYVPESPNKYSKQQQSQDAHEAIRPTSLAYSPAEVAPFLNRDQLKLYTLIWNRFLASQMTPQIAQRLTVTIRAGKFELRAVGRHIIFDGFTAVYGTKDKKEETILPELHKDDALTVKKIEPKQHFTQPPARYTEASLIKLLEEKGIGRPSTYAPILDTIQKRNYVEKRDKAFIPTELGFVVVDLLKRFFSKVVDVKFTSRMEEELDKIADGELSYEQLLESFYRVFAQELSDAEQKIDKVKVIEQESDVICDKCGAKMIYKFGRYGKFLACPNFPECKNTKPITDPVGIACPKCKKGHIVRRKSKRGRVFYGCDRYPECDLALWNEPVDQFCKECGSIMVKKKTRQRGEEIICSNKECPTHGNQKKK